MSGLVSVSWKRHCIEICQHNVWQNIFPKLAYLPEYFTRTHACAHVPAIWCSCTLLSWCVKIRCTFRVKTLHKLLLTCKRCLASALVWRRSASALLYIYILWDDCIFFDVYTSHGGSIFEEKLSSSPSSCSFSGSTKTSFTVILVDALDILYMSCL